MARKFYRVPQGDRDPFQRRARRKPPKSVHGRRILSTPGHTWTEKSADLLEEVRGSCRKEDWLPELAALIQTEELVKLVSIPFKSKMEANWGRWLDFLTTNRIKSEKGNLVTAWIYEPCRFWFPVARGTRTYVPDFLVLFQDGRLEFQETKGYMDKVSATQIRRFREHFPELTLWVVDDKTYRAVAKRIKTIVPGWE